MLPGPSPGAKFFVVIPLIDSGWELVCAEGDVAAVAAVDGSGCCDVEALGARAALSRLFVALFEFVLRGDEAEGDGSVGAVGF